MHTLDKPRASCKTAKPFSQASFAPSLLKAAWVPSGKATHMLGLCSLQKAKLSFKRIWNMPLTSVSGSFILSSCCHILHWPFPCKQGWGKTLHLCSAAQLGTPQGGVSARVGFAALDSPLPAWFAVSVTATEKSSAACTVLLFQAGEVQHSLQGETPKFIFFAEICLWVDHAHTHTQC